MVDMVTKPNTSVTPNKLCQSPCAAGYIKTGISGSQGPSTKITNNAQGVMDFSLP